MWFSDSLIWNEFSPRSWVEKWIFFFTNSYFIIQTPKKIGCIPCIFRFMKSTHPLNTLLVTRSQGIHSSNYIIWTVSAQIWSFFVTWKTSLRTILIIITLILVFYVIASCFRRVLVENLVFRLLGQIAPKFY